MTAIHVRALVVSLLAAASASGQFQQELLLALDGSQQKSIALAKVVPAEKYEWRPAPDVRSMGEVFVHLANGNELLLRLVNGPARTTNDAGFLKAIETNANREKRVVEKAAIVELLIRSFDQVRAALAKATETDLARPVEFFGKKTTVRGVFILIADHCSEHTGQAIAYARMNGVVPPWSQPAK